MKKTHKSRVYLLTALASVLLLTNSCRKDEGKTPPALSTYEVSHALQTSAISGGSISNDGDGVITERGVCYSTTHYPTIVNTRTVTTETTAAFICNLQGLTPNTLYFLRAYATNGVGTGYGNEVSFRTIPYGSYKVFDIDSNVYNTVTIGTQVWLLENLKTTRYRNGSVIPNITGDTEWANKTTGAYCWNYNDIANKTTYGLLYNHYAVTDSRNLCPAGWHVPTFAEWMTLEDYLGGSSVAGGKLKATTLWQSPNTGADNSSGFTALPGGGRNHDGSFSAVTINAYWWSSTVLESASFAWSFGMYFGRSSVDNSGDNRKYGYSVRCIRDF